MAQDEKRCPICHERGGHSLSCPTRWYVKPTPTPNAGLLSAQTGTYKAGE